MKNLIQDSRKNIGVKPNKQLQVSKLSSKMAGREGTYIVNIKNHKTSKKDLGKIDLEHEEKGKICKIPMPPTSSSMPTLSMATSPHEKKRLLNRSEVVCNELRANKQEDNAKSELFVEKMKLERSTMGSSQTLISNYGGNEKKKLKQRNPREQVNIEKSEIKKSTSILDTKLPPLEDKSNNKTGRNSTRKSNKQLKMIPTPFRTQEIQNDKERNGGIAELTSDSSSSFPHVENTSGKRNSRRKSRKDNNNNFENVSEETDKNKVQYDDTNTAMISQSRIGSLKRVKKHYSNLNKVVDNMPDVRDHVIRDMTSPATEFRNTRAGVKLESLTIKRQKEISKEPLENQGQPRNLEQNPLRRKHSNIKLKQPDFGSGVKTIFRIDDGDLSKQLLPSPPEQRCIRDDEDVLKMQEIRRQTALVREKGNRLCLARRKLAPMEK